MRIRCAVSGRALTSTGVPSAPPRARAMCASPDGERSPLGCCFACFKMRAGRGWSLGPPCVSAVCALGLISMDTEPDTPPVKTRPCMVITVSPASWALRGSGKVKYRRGLGKNTETQGLGFLPVSASSAGSGNTAWAQAGASLWAPSSPAGGFGLSWPQFLICKTGWFRSQVLALPPRGPSQEGSTCARRSPACSLCAGAMTQTRSCS